MIKHSENKTPQTMKIDPNITRFQKELPVVRASTNYNKLGGPYFLLVQYRLHGKQKLKLCWACEAMLTKSSFNRKD